MFYGGNPDSPFSSLVDIAAWCLSDGMNGNDQRRMRCTR